MAQPGSALGWGSRGRKFESCPPDEIKTISLTGSGFCFLKLILSMPHFVYILKSEKDNKYYIGETANVNARLLFHNAGKQRSTKNRIPFVIVVIEEFDTRELALIRERQIKSWKGGKAFKKLIEVVAPPLAGH